MKMLLFNRCWMFICGLLFCSCLVLPATDEAVREIQKLIDVIDAPAIQNLIDSLGASDHKTREQATAMLLRIGKPAQALLEKAVASDDPEISIRAGEILKTVRLGIHYSWPESLKARMRNYENLPQRDMFRLIDDLCDSYQKDAMPFLLERTAKGSDSEARHIVSRIKRDKKPPKRTLKLIMRYLQKPANKHQSDLLVFACTRTGDTEDLIKLLASDHLSKNNKSSLTRTCVKKLMQLMLNLECKQAKKHAAECVAAVPDDARFRYILAAVLEEEGDVKGAKELCKSALELNKDSESHHYQAGEVLMDLGLYRLASLEWGKILEIPPAKDVYDMNAHFRLGRIYRHSRMYTKAAEEYEEGLKEYETARKNSHSMGMIGGGVDAVKDKVKWLRKRVADGKDLGNSDVKDDIGIMNISITTEVIIKDGKKEEMEKALAKTILGMSANVQPHGFRLFETAKATIKYDTEKKQFDIMMNGSPVTESYPYKMRVDKADIAVRTLDMCYVYTVDSGTGDAVLAGAYESDYIVRIKFGSKIKNLKDADITVNDKARTQAELLEGLEMDYLPIRFETHVKGTTADGERLSLCRIIEANQILKHKASSEDPVAVKIDIRVGR